MILLKFVHLAILFKISDSARILAVIPTASYSHQVVFQPLWKELSLRGHQVTLLTTNPINDSTLTNLTEIDLSFSYKILKEDLPEIINSSKNPFKSFDLTIKSFVNVCDKQLEHPQVQKLIRDPSEHFDLVMAEYIMGSSFYFARRFNCPYIGFFSVDPNMMVYNSVGNPTHPIVYPNALSEIYEKPTLLQRVFLILLELFFSFFMNQIMAYEEQLARKHFQDDTPSIIVRSNASLLFVNSNPIFDPIKPLVPSVIQIGGIVERIPVKPLNKEIKNFLDYAHEGFIYFSLGSNVKSTDIPPKTMTVILQTFQELPYKVLWKYEQNKLPNQPRNVVISKWVSQQEVLHHPNLKLFITHGGGQSIEETFSAGVPIVGMPFFVDQPFNIKKMVSKGCGLIIDYREMTKEEFKETILEVIKNPTYRNRVKQLSELAADQPMTGLERAIWWTEYVIRHKGAAHLRSPYLDIPFYQYYLLDVICVMLVAVAIMFFMLTLCLKQLVKVTKFVCGKKVKVKKH